MKKIIYFLCVGFILFGCNSGIESGLPTEEGEEASVEGEYSITGYVYPSDLGWYNTTQEGLAALQVPTGTLKKMTTQAVIQAILDHPMMLEVFWKYQYQSDWNIFAAPNACVELTKRKDAGKLLLERFVNVNPLPLEPGGIKDMALEFLFSQYLDNLNIDDTRTIVEEAITNYELRQENLEENAFFIRNRHVTLVLISRAMLAAGYTPFVNAVNENQDLKAYCGGNASYIYNTEGSYTNSPLSSTLFFTEVDLSYSYILPLIIDYGITFISEK